jgi:hypothetical protein
MPNLYYSGALVNDNGTIYYISGSSKIPFTNLSAFLGLRYSLRNVIDGDTSAYAITDGYTLSSSSQSHPWGSWLLYGTTVYYSTPDGMIPVPSWDVFVANNGRSSFILPMNSADLSVLRSKPSLPVMVPEDSRVRW